MTRETQLAALVGQALFIGRREAARTYARANNCPVWVVRTRAGFRAVMARPTMGEHWQVEPNGQVTHCPAPVV